MAFDVIVLAGGAGRRLGGADKALIEVGGRALLERILDASHAAERTIVVGPRRPTSRPVLWCREAPAGGGPLAGIAEGIRHVTAQDCVVLAVDHPFVTEHTVARLLEALEGVEAAVGVDEDGRDQPLVAAYRASALHSSLRALGESRGLAARRVLHGLTLSRVLLGADAVDVDTDEDLESLRSRPEEPR